MVNLLKEKERLNYSDVYVYSQTLYQSAYLHLKEYYGDMEKWIKYHSGQPVEIDHFFDNDEDIISLESLDKNKNHIMILMMLC